MVFLECQDIIKLFTDPVNNIKVPALRGVELDVDKGDLVAIIGPSGSGKSTLISIIGGIYKPSSGIVIVNDRDITKMRAKELTNYRRYNIGFLYQFPKRNLIWNITAYQNVILPMKYLSHWGLQEQKKRTLDLLKKVGLERRKDNHPYQLSGGEAQRLGIAVALANDPDILLADEPTGELDSVTTFKIIKYFQEINQDLGKTIIVVSHDNRFTNMTNYSVRILDGRIIGMHKPKDNSSVLTEREEFFYIDDHGNVRIPEKLRKKVKLGKYAKFEIINGNLTIIPRKTIQE